MKTQANISSAELETNNLIRVSFGEVIRQRRVLAGFSQRGFARAVGISNSHLRKIESGETSPSLITVYRFAYVLDQPASELIVEMDSKLQSRNS